jgi:hypothetical protein
MRRLVLCCLTFPLMIFAAKKERNWKIGKVAEPTAQAITSGSHQSSVDAHILDIQGDDYIYTVQEKHAWNSWCLLIAGDKIKYAQDKRNLYILDADGDKCKFDIVREEKRQ